MAVKTINDITQGNSEERQRTETENKTQIVQYNQVKKKITETKSAKTTKNCFC